MPSSLSPLSGDKATDVNVIMEQYADVCGDDDDDWESESQPSDGATGNYVPSTSTAFADEPYEPAFVQKPVAPLPGDPPADKWVLLPVYGDWQFAKPVPDRRIANFIQTLPRSRKAPVAPSSSKSASRCIVAR